MNRRTWMQGVGAAALAGAVTRGASAGELPEPSAGKLPVWRGFNLLDMFMQPYNARQFRESDFAEIAEMGFNFVRLPLDYRLWIDGKDWKKFREDRLKWVDEAVAFGHKHKVHVQINFHRAPGYTVASPAEEKSVWTDPEALAVCALHWETFAKRYQGIPSRELSFNPFNEPARVAPEPHKAVIQHMVETIRKVDKGRLIVCDGRDYGTKPPTELVGLDVAAATRGYAPFHLTHYRASWVNGSDKWEKPTYPLKEGKTTWDKSNLQNDQIKPWKALQAKGVGVMVGEFGAHNQTPHEVVLPWMADCLATWKDAGWGWALWNYRGSFGVVDSDRADVKYESWNGKKLDRAMLKVLQTH